MFLVFKFVFVLCVVCLVPALADRSVRILQFLDEPSCNMGVNQPIKNTNGTFIYLSTPYFKDFFRCPFLTERSFFIELKRQR